MDMIRTYFHNILSLPSGVYTRQTSPHAVIALWHYQINAVTIRLASYRAHTYLSGTYSERRLHNRIMVYRSTWPTIDVRSMECQAQVVLTESC